MTFFERLVLAEVLLKVSLDVLLKFLLWSVLNLTEIFCYKWLFFFFFFFWSLFLNVAVGRVAQVHILQSLKM